MYMFVTIRCSCCGAVMYNLPSCETIKLEHLNLVCEDCVEKDNSENSYVAKEIETYTNLNLVLHPYS